MSPARSHVQPLRKKTISRIAIDSLTMNRHRSASFSNLDGERPCPPRTNSGLFFKFPSIPPAPSSRTMNVAALHWFWFRGRGGVFCTNRRQCRAALSVSVTNALLLKRFLAHTLSTVSAKSGGTVTFKFRALSRFCFLGLPMRDSKH